MHIACTTNAPLLQFGSFLGDVCLPLSPYLSHLAHGPLKELVEYIVSSHRISNVCASTLKLIDFNKLSLLLNAINENKAKEKKTAKEKRNEARR